MPSGGCFCDKVRISYTGEPEAHVLCHCLDCRKITGSTYSNNAIVKEENFKLESGTPKQISKVGDSGNKITSSFCGDCGTTLFRTGPSFPGLVVVKVGTLDDANWPNQNVPKGEIFTGGRVNWFPAIKGADQLPGMP